MLPTIVTPRYELKVPSTGKKVSYRTYLVKEEKILMLAMETEDQSQILQAMKNVISSCTFEKLDVESLFLFDIEYIFLKLRSKSVGEISKVNIKCEKCTKASEVEINLDEIEVIMPEASNKIKLTDKVGIVMTWPKIEVIEKARDNEKTASKMQNATDMIIACIVSIYDEKSVHNAADVPKEELEQFLDTLNQTQFTKIQQYLEAMPKLEHNVEFTCKHCKAENKLLLGGLSSFFA